MTTSLALATLLLSAAAVSNVSYDTPDGGFVLRHEVIVRILAFLPGRMLAFQAERPPPDFPHPELLDGLFTVVEIEPHGEHASRVTVSGVGYTDAPGHRELRTFFERGNAWTLERLAERFASGPADWSTLRQSPD